MNSPSHLAVLGATGSVGKSTLDVARLHPDRIRTVALAGWRNTDRLLAISREFSPAGVCVADEKATLFRSQVLGAGLNCRVLSGPTGLIELVQSEQVDTVVAGIAGAAGLSSTLAAVQAGKRVLIANKEPLVMCGELLRAEARAAKAVILPVDSEHNAVFQCLPEAHQTNLSRGVFGAVPTSDQSPISRITLTASGGPFIRTPAPDLKSVTIKEALAHPNWQMGPKITVDSATLMNKGLELIEACVFFDLPESQIDVVIHPQSVIHSLVHYVDGSVLAQMASPDMRIPLAHALAFPGRIRSGAPTLNLIEVSRLDFEEPDVARFPCLRLAREAARIGKGMPAVLNAANEVAVEAFLSGRLRFVDIPVLVEAVMERSDCPVINGLDDALGVDQNARHLAVEALKMRSVR